MPSGFSRLCPGPAPKPSTETEKPATRTRVMLPPPIADRLYHAPSGNAGPARPLHIAGGLHDFVTDRFEVFDFARIRGRGLFRLRRRHERCAAVAAAGAVGHAARHGHAEP